MFSVYTRRLTKGELFKGLQRRLLGKLGVTAEAGHKVDRFSNRHGNAEIQCDSAVLTGAAGYFFEAVRDIRLRALVKLHVGVDGKAVSTFHADAPPFSIRLHEAAVDAEFVALANGAVNRGQSLFNFFRRESGHTVPHFIMKGSLRV